MTTSTLFLATLFLLLCLIGLTYTFQYKSSSAVTTYRNRVSVTKMTLSLSPSLVEIENLLKHQESTEERRSFELMTNESGRGAANHKANTRLFDAPDDYEPEITLYRDTAGWCPYCQKVWFYLEEKRIPYKVIKVPMRCYGEKPKEFFRISPSGGIPVAIVKGKVIGESNDIINIIEKEYTNYKRLRPDNPRIPSLLKLERKAFSIWFSWLTSRGNTSERNDMDSVLKQVDYELSVTEGSYFLGDDVSIVDVMFTPFLERMAASLPYYKGFECRCDKYPHLLRWYEAMDTRDSYIGIKSDYYTHVKDLPPQIGACQFTDSAAVYTKAIDGGDWEINSDCFEPMQPLDKGVACRDAVRRSLSNFDALVRFTLRSVGTAGNPRVSSPLSDPYAKPNLSYEAEVAAALRLVLMIMLTNDYDSIAASSSSDYKKFMSSLNKEVVVKCMLYLRDRISVPRDMSIHGARQLRAHINYFIDKI